MKPSNDNPSPKKQARKMHKEFAAWCEANEASMDKPTKLIAHKIKWGLWSLANGPDSPVMRRALEQESKELADLLAKKK